MKNHMMAPVKINLKEKIDKINFNLIIQIQNKNQNLSKYHKQIH